MYPMFSYDTQIITLLRVFLTNEVLPADAVAHEGPGSELCGSKHCCQSRVPSLSLLDGKKKVSLVPKPRECFLQCAMRKHVKTFSTFISGLCLFVYKNFRNTIPFLADQ